MTPTDICNLALSYLGDTATVASIDPPEGSVQAQHCARFYPIAQKLLLEAHDWNFVTKRDYLPLISCGDQLYAPWRFMYGVPPDLNTLLSVLPKICYSDWWAQSWSFPFTNDWWGFGNAPLGFEQNYIQDFILEVNADGNQVVLSNCPDAVARFTFDTVTTNSFSALFTDALAWKLASMLAGPLLKGDAGMKQAASCLAMHARVLGMAEAQDANQQIKAPRPQPVWIRDR